MRWERKIEYVSERGRAVEKEGKNRLFPYSRKAGQRKMVKFRIGTRKRTFNFDKARHPRREYMDGDFVNSRS
jgi:hypothetical protein